MHARSWFVLTAVCTLVCTSGCGSARWGNRHSRLHMPSQCVEGCCDDPTCEICSPLPPLYDGMARNHRLNRRAGRGHSHGHGRHNGGCPYCGRCDDGEWFEGEIIEGEIIGGDCCFGGCSSCMSCGGCSSCSSCGDGMIIDGMPMQGGCSSCQQHSMMGSSMPQSAMMQGQSFEMQEQQPTLAPHQPQQQRSSAVPSGGPVSPPSRSTVPGDLNANPMGSPMGSPMSQPTNTPESPMPMSMRTPNYGAALFGSSNSQPMPTMTASAGQPVIQEQAIPMQEMLQSPMPMSSSMSMASPVAQSQPMPMPMAAPSMPTFPVEQTAAPQPSDFYSPKDAPTQPAAAAPNPIQLQSASIPATPGKKAMRPFSEAAKPKKQAAQPVLQPSATPSLQSPPPSPGQPQWEGTLKMQPVQQVQQASGELPALPRRGF